MLRHWWYGIIPPWTAFPPLSLCKILPLCIYFTFFGIKYLLNGLCFLCCWYSVIIFLVFMYSVCIVNIFRAFSPFFWFYCKVVIFYPATIQRDSLPIGFCWWLSCPIVSEVESVSALFCFSRSCLNILCFLLFSVFSFLFFSPEDWAVNWNWSYTLYLFDNLIRGMEVNKLAFCMENIGISACIYIYLISIFAPWIPMRIFYTILDLSNITLFLVPITSHYHHLK